ncbi:MAG: aldehyde dehydrogenase family protein [Elusimicrobia bacterium]|nr:aldehyde dehydrogenase family protein [Elusimicrobiota bacterium]
MPTATQFKVTYTSANADMGEFHKFFDEALALVKKRAGREYPLYIYGQPVKSTLPPLTDTSPINTSIVLGKFASATEQHVDQAVRAARGAQKHWARTPWQDRLKIMRKAAGGIRERKFELGAIMSLEVGKSRMEAMGDAEESADLIDYYCQQMKDNQGYIRPLGRLSPNENTKDVLKPYGVFACIAPFNFPLALSTGMSSAALIAGNSVIYKPPQDAPWIGLMLYEIYTKAGIPAGVFQYLSGRGSIMGNALCHHPGVDGIVFTGSKKLGMKLHKEFSTQWVKPVLMELGGKNPAIVTRTADLDKAAQGVIRSAFGLQGQKCSACSRVYVDNKAAAKFIEKLIDKTRAMKIGDPTERDVFFGPVINQAAVDKFVQAMETAKKGEKVLAGGKRLTGGIFARGYFVEPTIIELPLDHPLWLEELFVPVLCLGRVSSLEEAIKESNKAEFGLTAGIFSQESEEIETFFNEIEAGVCYANRATGATTGAWPGVQSFCGWKGSGSSGKGGCGPYYVAQFMREQSQTIME